MKVLTRDADRLRYTEDSTCHINCAVSILYTNPCIRGVDFGTNGIGND